MTAIDLWTVVVKTMRDHAVASEDSFVYYVAEKAGTDVSDHQADGDGCDACRGDVALCGRWETTQEILLTWLMQQVDRG